MTTFASTSTSTSTRTRTPTRVSWSHLKSCTPPLLSRSSSSQSDNSTMSIETTQNGWKPRQAVILPGVTSIATTEGKKAYTERNTGKESMRTRKVERDLSDLYVENERRSPRKQSHKRRSWGGSIVHGVMDVTVFGAALGLTAYRVWTGKGITPQGEEGGEGPIAQPRSDPHTHPTTAEPPPAYQAVYEGENEYSSPDTDKWIDENIKDVHSPTSHKRVQSNSSRSSPRSHRKRRSRTYKTPLRSLAGSESITIEEPHLSLPLIDSGNPSVGIDRSKDPVDELDDNDGDDDLVEPLEMVHRLEAMSLRLSQMITEGKRALSSPSPLLLSSEWEDVEPEAVL